MVQTRASSQRASLEAAQPASPASPAVSKVPQQDQEGTPIMLGRSARPQKRQLAGEGERDDLAPNDLAWDRDQPRTPEAVAAEEDVDEALEDTLELPAGPQGTLGRATRGLRRISDVFLRAALNPLYSPSSQRPCLLTLREIEQRIEEKLVEKLAEERQRREAAEAQLRGELDAARDAHDALQRAHDELQRAHDELSSDYREAVERAGEAAQAQKGRIDRLEREVQTLLAAAGDGTAAEGMAELRALAGSSGGAAAAAQSQPPPPPPPPRQQQQQQQQRRRPQACRGPAEWELEDAATQEAMRHFVVRGVRVAVDVAADADTDTLNTALATAAAGKVLETAEVLAQAGAPDGAPAVPPLQYTDAAVMTAVKESEATYVVSASFKLKTEPARRAFMRVRRSLATGGDAVAGRIDMFRTPRQAAQLRALHGDADFAAALNKAAASGRDGGPRTPIIWLPGGCVIGADYWSVTDPEVLRQYAAPPRRVGGRAPTATARGAAA